MKNKQSAKMPAVSMKPIPDEKFIFLREHLKVACLAREEMFRHIQTLIREEDARHEIAWDQVAKMFGFLSVADVRRNGLVLRIDFTKRTVSIEKEKT